MKPVSQSITLFSYYYASHFENMLYFQDIDLGYVSGVKVFRTSCFGDQENDWKLLVPSEVSYVIEQLL